MSQYSITPHDDFEAVKLKDPTASGRYELSEAPRYSQTQDGPDKVAVTSQASQPTITDARLPCEEFSGSVDWLLQFDSVRSVHRCCGFDFELHNASTGDRIQFKRLSKLYSSSFEVWYSGIHVASFVVEAKSLRARMLGSGRCTVECPPGVTVFKSDTTGGGRYGGRRQPLYYRAWLTDPSGTDVEFVQKELNGFCSPLGNLVDSAKRNLGYFENSMRWGPVQCTVNPGTTPVDRLVVLDFAVRSLCRLWSYPTVWTFWVVILPFVLFVIAVIVVMVLVIRSFEIGYPANN